MEVIEALPLRRAELPEVVADPDLPVRIAPGSEVARCGEADDAVAADPDEGQRAAKAGRGRGVDEAAFAQRLDALVDDAVGDRDALACVDFAQARAQRLVTFPE